MGSLRCRLPARILLSTLLAALAPTMAAVTAEAAGSGLSLAVHVGYQDVVKPGEWTPVTVDVRNAGADVDGLLEVQESLNAQPGVIGFTIYQQPISLPGGASKRVRTYLVEDTTGATVTARIVSNGRTLISQDSVTSSTTSTLIGVLSDQASARDHSAHGAPGHAERAPGTRRRGAEHRGGFRGCRKRPGMAERGRRSAHRGPRGRRRDRDDGDLRLEPGSDRRLEWDQGPAASGAGPCRLRSCGIRHELPEWHGRAISAVQRLDALGGVE